MFVLTIFILICVWRDLYLITLQSGTNHPVKGI